MKKQLLAIVLAVCAIICLFAITATANEGSFRAGYALVDITPAEDAGLPLQGYGNPNRIFDGIESNLSVSCIAMTDKTDITALLISVDTYNTSQLWSNDAKAAIVEAMGESVIDVDRIYISATTTMSAPDLIYTGTDPEVKAKVDAYRQTVIDACVTAAQSAFDDRCPVTMQHNNMDASEAIVHINGEGTSDGDLTTRLNYNIHYNVVSKSDPSVSYVASNSFGPSHLLSNNNYNVTEVAQPDDTMGLLIFRPEDNTKDPIVLANWSAKANISSSGVNRYGIANYNKLSADYVGFFRDEMENEYGMRTVFFQGTSGNVSAFPLIAGLRNPDVVQNDFPYVEEVDGQPVEKTGSTITPQLYGMKLAMIANHGLTHSDGEDHLHDADVNATINNLKFRFATRPDIPAAEQIALINLLKTTSVSATIVEADPEMGVYTNLYEYLLDNWGTGKPLAVQQLTDADETEAAATLNALKKVAQLSGIAARITHTVNATTTNFATDAVYCDATVLQLGKMTFVMAPADLYDFYGDYNNPSSNGWEDVAAHFVLGNTNGASGYLPNSASFHYNEGSDEYFTGTNNTLSTIFPEGAGELLMEAYTNVKKTMTATVEGAENHDPNNAIRVQCECGGKAVGKAGHTCVEKEFIPWYDPDSLPVSGNYYLMTDIVLLREARSGTAIKSIDLNGHTITRKVLPEIQLDTTGEEIPSNHYYQGTRLFALEHHSRLTITDTVGTGKLLRDISDLNAISADEQKKITNYGLLVAIIDQNTSEFILYNGTLDATGQYSGGGACVANMSSTATFTMYGGELIGGVSDRGAAVYAGGTNKFYGGSITGGEVKDTAGDADDNADKNGNVNLIGIGKLLLAGDFTISGGKRGDDDCNLVIKNSDSLSVDENYTGSAGISVNVDDPNGTIIGWLENIPEVTHDNFTVDNYDNYVVTLCNRRAVTIAEIRTYCACGGKAVGAHDHICQDIQWKPWPTTYNKYLPDNDLGGNYYLLTDISMETQKIISNELHLDLNGHNITHVVTPGEKTLKELNDAGTRVFYIAANGSLTLTDSTANPGTVTRDLSKLSDEQKNGITNYGIIVMMNNESTGDFVLFDGILDATDQITGGGAVSNLNQSLAIRIYGGTINGGIAPNGGCIYSQGYVRLHGGTLTGGKSTNETGSGGIIITATGYLYLCGNVNISGNTNKNGVEANIKVPSADRFIVEDDFVGTAGVLLNAKPTHLMQVAKSDAVDLNTATFRGDNYTDGYEFRVVDGYIVTYMDAAFITDEGNPVTYYKTLSDAFGAYPGGNATITLQRDIAENDLTIDENVFLNLAGWDVANTGFTNQGYKLYVYDTETDDYTTENGNGYGKLSGDIVNSAAGVAANTQLTGVASPTDNYAMITEENETSFHRVNLKIIGITLRPDIVGVYYTSQFGGDEVVKRNLTAYGVALGAIEEPSFRDATYTALNPNTWIVGAKANGAPNNQSSGTPLENVMVAGRKYSINSRNASVMINGLPYIDLVDGTRIKGDMVSYSLRNIFESAPGLTGADARWNEWSAAEKTNILNIFRTFYAVMSDWNIPNIIAAAR